MPYRFSSRKAIHVLLFMLQCLGGKGVNVNRLFLLLYFADLKHMGKYGSMVTGDTYIALKFGPAPFYILQLIKQLKDAPIEKAEHNYKHYFKLEEDCELVARTSYDITHLSSSEVECMYETIHELKAYPLQDLCEKAKQRGWTSSNVFGEISLPDMALESGANQAMICYIETCYQDEVFSFVN